MSDINVGVIGTGRMAASMVAALARTNRATLIGVASSSGNSDRASRFAQSFRIPQAFAHPEELLDLAEIELVYIAGPTVSHARLSIAALEKGKAVLCEKPFATTVGEGQTVIDAARRSGSFYMEGIWTPFLPAYRRAFELLSSNAIGKPTHLAASFGYPASAAAYPDLFEPGGGGALLDRGAYPISLALSVLGPVTSVHPNVSRNANGVDVEVALQLSHEKGGTSQLAVSLTTLLGNSAVISGPNGSITIAPPLVGAEEITVRRAMAYGRRPTVGRPTSISQVIIDQLKTSELVRRINRRLGKFSHEHRGFGTDQYVPMLDHVLTRIESRHGQSDLVPLDFSMQVLAIIEEARGRAISTGLSMGGAP